MAAVNLLKSLKVQVIQAYTKYVKLLEKGYPMEGYDIISEAIEAIEFITTYEPEELIKVKILEYYILKIKDGR